MTLHFNPPVEPANGSATIVVVESLRRWRTARDDGRPAQPGLYQLLSRRGHEMLAPVLDSLFHLCEAALGRRLIVGATASFSCDECLVVGLLDGSRSCRKCIACPESAAATLDCAICSTRLLMAMR